MSPLLIVVLAFFCPATNLYKPVLERFDCSIPESVKIKRRHLWSDVYETGTCIPLITQNLCVLLVVFQALLARNTKGGSQQAASLGR